MRHFPGHGSRALEAGASGAPAAAPGGRSGLNRHPPSSVSGLRAGLPRSSAAVRGQRRGPLAAAGGRPLRRCGAAAAALASHGHWDAGRGMGCGREGCLGAELTPARVTSCHLKGRGRRASRERLRRGPARTIRMENTKNQTWPRGSLSSCCHSPAHCSSSNGSRASLAPSFLPGCFFHGAATPPPVLRKHNCEVAPPPLPLAPFPARPSNPPLGRSPDQLGLSRVAKSSSGHLCCPLERGPLSMGRWDIFFFFVLIVFSWFQSLLKIA